MACQLQLLESEKNIFQGGKGMKESKISFLLVFCLIITLLSCGGSGSDGGFSSGGGDFIGTVKENGTIEGTVQEIVVSKAVEEPTSFWTKYFFIPSIIKYAFAEGGELCEIPVTAVQEGVIVASTVTNCEGKFVLLEIPPGLTEIIIGEMGRAEVEVPEGGKVVVKVSINMENPDSLTIDEINVVQGPVECEGGTLTVGGDEINDLTIIGEGGDCVVVHGNCDVEIVADNVNLEDCNMCVNADGSSLVVINAQDGELGCDSKNGIVAEEESEVVLISETCTVEGPGEPIVKGDFAKVNTEGCEEIEIVENGGNDKLVCEFDCVGDDCNLFCNDNVPLECVELCGNSTNTSACLADCAGAECGEEVCEEGCVEKEVECLRTEEECVEGVSVCTREEEVCEQVCVSGSECIRSECVEFEEFCVREEEVCNCVKSGCTKFEEVCECAEFGCTQFGEEVCDCVEFGCTKFELVCEGEGENKVCDEVCVEEGCVKEVCEPTCVEEGCVKEVCEPTCVEDGCIEEVCELKCVEEGKECIREECVEFSGECTQFEEVCETVCVEDETVCEKFEEVCVEEEVTCLQEGIFCRVECEQIF